MQPSRQVRNIITHLLLCSKFFKQTEVCKLSDCPVAGGWGHWVEWDHCNHNCVYHPSSSKQTAAYRQRRRYCNKPLPAFGGAKCAKDSKYRWVSHLKAEEERSACCTGDDHGECEGVITPWCPGDPLTSTSPQRTVSTACGASGATAVRPASYPRAQFPGPAPTRRAGASGSSWPRTSTRARPASPAGSPPSRGTGSS